MEARKSRDVKGEKSLRLCFFSLLCKICVKEKKQRINDRLKWTENGGNGKKSVIYMFQLWRRKKKERPLKESTF